MSDRQNKELNDLLRQSRPANKVHWVPEDSPDPADQAADRDSLNKAIRRASGWAQESDGDDQPRRWKSLEPDRRGRA